MSFFRLIAGSALTALLAITACAPEAPTDEQDDTSSERASELKLDFVEVPFSKSGAPPGVTVIKNRTQFKSFFGVEAPSDLKFNKNWLIHFSMGGQNTGGYDANILDVERVGSGVNARLVITTEAVSPGPLCIVTQALTNPQVTVKIKKQNSNIAIDTNATETVTDCSQPNWCHAAKCSAGFHCDELSDGCVPDEDAFCPRVRCANGFSCDETVDACVPRACDPNVADTCPSGFQCANQIACITQPCPEDYRCVEADPCQGISWEGQCENNTLSYCENQSLTVIPCGNATCGWDQAHNYNDCL
jgi:hypothetical protein